MLMNREQIVDALGTKEIIINPVADKIEPASYDFRVGARAFASSSKDIVILEQKGVLIIEPGEFAVLESQEHVELSKTVAAQLGLRSEFARQGLLMLCGPQIDPGFKGVLVVRVVNLAPKRIVLQHGAPFLTAQFFHLNQAVKQGYSGEHQGQTGITARDIQELTETEGLTLGQVMKTLSALANDVSQLRSSVERMTWSIPLIVVLGMAMIAILVYVRH